MKSKLAIIILNWNSTNNTLNCLKSVMANNYDSQQVYVVDNKSDADPAPVISSEYPEVIFIQTGRNLGYAGGNNVAMKAAFANGADYVLIVNPDVLLEPDSLRLLIEYADAHPDAGLICPKIYWSGHQCDGKPVLWWAGGLINWKNLETLSIGFGEVDDGQYDIPREWDRLNGACLLVRKALFDLIGGIPELYFLYYEESDYCVKAKDSGYTLMYAPQVTVSHEGEASVGANSAKREYYFSRNRLLFAKRNASKVNWVYFIPYAGYTSVKRILKFVLKGKLRISRAIITGNWDGVRGIAGQGPMWLDKL